MPMNILKDYISRRQVRLYLDYLIEHGVSEITEAPDHIHSSEPMHLRIGSTVTSVRDYHVSRHHDEMRMSQVGVTLVSDDEKPAIPDNAISVGIFYMSRDFNGEGDSLSGEVFDPTGGDVVWVDASDYNEMSFGKTTDGVNYRLVVSWAAK